MMFLRRALLLTLTGLSTASCGFLYDFDGYQVTQEGSGGQGGGGGQGGSSSTGGTGGAGGASACEGIDTSSDSMNCGACGIDCAGGECKDGVCWPFGFLVGGAATQVASVDEVVFVVRGDISGSALVTFPVNFTFKTNPGLNESVCDVNGFLSVGSGRAHYRPQNPLDCDPDTYIFSCNTAGSCAKTAYDLGMNHINGMVVVGSSLYFTTQDAKIHAADISADGVPVMPESASPPVADMEAIGEGAYLLDYDVSRDAIWWTTYNMNGCVYRVDRTAFPVATASCFPQTVTNPGLLLVSPTADIYVQSLLNSQPHQIMRIQPEAADAIAPPFVDTPNLSLLAVDNDYVYAYDGGDMKGLIMLRHGSGKERARVPFPTVISSADARHPLYVFFTSGGSLYRLRKPLP